MKIKIEQMEDGNTRIRIPIEFRYDNGRKRIFYTEFPDEHLKINESLATGIARAYRWQELLDSGEFDSPEALAEALNVNVSYVRRFLRLTLLAPPIVEAIFEGRAPWSLSLTKLDTNLPFSWKEQMKLFGMESRPKFQLRQSRVKTPFCRSFFVSGIPNFVIKHQEKRRIL